MTNVSIKRAFRPCWFVSMLFVLTLTGVTAHAGGLRFEAQLIWGTNDEKPPNPRLKEVGPEIRKKLAGLPLKWKKYFEVNQKQLTVPKGGDNQVSLSEKCEIVVKHIEVDQVEVSLISKKKNEVVMKRTQPFPKGEILVLGGNAPNSTSWLATLKRIE